MAIATNTTLGDIQLAGDLAGSNNGLAPELTAVTDLAPGNTNPAGSYVLPTITVDAKGRILTAVEVDPEDILPIIPNASTSVKGQVQIGSNLSVTSGVVSVPVGSASVAGVVRPDGTSVSVNNGVISVDLGNIPQASNSVYGLVRIQDGGGITVTDGVISADVPPLASSIQKGILQAGANISISPESVISIPKATSSVFGVVRAGQGLTVVDGVMSLNTSVIATDTTPGLVSIGDNIENGPNGFRPAFQVASTTTLGLVKVGAGLSIDGSGVLSNTIVSSPPVASATQLGMVEIGTGINVDTGVISIPDATTSTKGIVRIGNIGITVSDGVINAKLASNSELGIVRPGDTNELFVDGSTLLRVGNNIPKKNAANTFTKAQTSALVNLGSRSGTVTLDLSAGNVQMVTLIGNVTLGTPTNVVAGGVYNIIVKQDSTGGRSISFSSAFKVQVMPLIDTRAQKITVISVVALDSSTLLTSISSGF